MPRSRRGGRRAVAKRYPNRTDLAGGGQIARQAATGQAYGMAKQQLDAQKAIPLRAPATAQPRGGQSNVVTFPPVGSLGAFNRPSERPDEPVTAGLPVGPGPGPEILQTRETMPGRNPTSLIELLASMPSASPILRALAEEQSVEPPPNTFLIDG